MTAPGIRSCPCRGRSGDRRGGRTAGRRRRIAVGGAARAARRTAACLLLLAAGLRAQQEVVTVTGRVLGGPAGSGPGGTVLRPVGVTFPVPQEAAFPPRGGAGGPLIPILLDGTLEFLPLAEWDLGDVETGDLNGDGLDDVAFPISVYDCDSIAGTRPRVWIQNAAHRFTDETAARIPALSSSTFDLDLFDADGDGDLDMLLGGYACLPQIVPATFLVNDGSGHFTEETAVRINAVPDRHFIYSAEPALINADPYPDIVAILVDLNQTSNPVYYPFLLLNTGDGTFWPDHQGRLLDYGPYGFFRVDAADFTGDGLQDLVFLNVASVGEGLDGRLALFRNAGDGFMVDETAARLGGDSLRRTRDVAIADVEGDGDLDLLDVGFFYGANIPQVRFLVNDGGGVFEDRTGPAFAALSGWFNDAEFFPLTDDSLPDLFITRVRVGEVDTDRLLLNRGEGVFQDSSSMLPPVSDFSIAVGPADFDLDGDWDLLIGNSGPVVDHGGQNRLYLNQTASPPTDVGLPPELPAASALGPNYPNPFNSVTVIPFSLVRSSAVTLVVTNTLGAVVDRRDAGELPPGRHELLWDAGSLPGGVYWYTILPPDPAVRARPMILLR